MWKRVVGGLVGLGYAICYGFWTMLLTGGGHGNFIWMILFFTSYLIGLFFPVMGALVVDLRSIIAKAIFGSFLFISLLVNIIMITPILMGQLGDATTDFQKTWVRDPSGTVVAAVIHFLPLIVLSIFLIRSIFFAKESIESNETVSLGLN